MKDGCLSALERMLSLARLIRRRGTSEEASTVTPYEIQLEKDIAARTALLAEQSASAPTQPMERAA